jgi:D-alanyl-D-alanine carboxypeptidase
MKLSQIIIDIASLHGIRSLYYHIASRYSDEDCYQAFVDEMNVDSQNIGLNDSLWVNASGLRDREIEAYTTAHDIAKMGIVAYKQGYINEFWSVKEYTCTIIKPYIHTLCNIKHKRVVSTIPYGKIGEKYKILGAKTGTGDGYNGLLCVCDIGDGNIISGAILDANLEELRFDAMNELVDIAYSIVNKKDNLNKRVEKAQKACAYLLNQNGVVECIFKQNADIKYPPMSLTKVLAFMTMSKYISHYNEWIIVKPFDEKKNDLIKKWSKLQISSLIYLSLLPSCCTASDTLARHCGNIILNKS